MKFWDVACLGSKLTPTSSSLACIYNCPDSICELFPIVGSEAHLAPFVRQYFPHTSRAFQYLISNHCVPLVMIRIKNGVLDSGQQ